MEESVKRMESALQTATNERVEALKERDHVKSTLNSLEYEHDLSKAQWKKREKELLDMLDEIRDESKIEEMQSKLKDTQNKLKDLETVSI